MPSEPKVMSKKLMDSYRRWNAPKDTFIYDTFAHIAALQLVVDAAVEVRLGGPGTFDGFVKIVEVYLDDLADAEK